MDDQKPLKILVADDDKSTCLLLKTALGNWGYDVILAETGDDVWRIINYPEAPHLLVMDVQMPGQSGLELCRRIRQEMAPDYNPYIILLTQSGGQDNLIKGLEAGANEFLSKPFYPAELRCRIAVAEKIVRYEDALKAQNDRLKDYIAQIETASSLVVNASESLGHAMQSGASLDANHHGLKNAHSAMDELIGVFKNFNPEKKK